MSFDIVIRRGDTLPKIQKTFYVGGSKMNLTGWTVKFVVNDLEGTELLNEDANLVDAPNGVVDYQWKEADSTAVSVDIAFARFVATKDSDVLTVPNNRPLSITLTSHQRHEYSYSGDPSARDIDRVRFLLSDTDMDRALFTDSEIEFMLAEYNSPYDAAAEAASIQASKYTNLANKTVGPLSIDYGSLGERWEKLSASLRKRATRASGAIAVFTGNPNADDGGHYFRLGMQDNPEIGMSPEWQNVTGE